MPAWLAYDLSGIPAAQRSTVLLAWYDPSVAAFQFNVSCGGNPNGLPRDYTLQANPAPGGSGVPPEDGWVTLVSITGNKLMHRQHLLNLTGYEWVRIFVSAVNGSASQVSINQMDLHDASLALEDSWSFFGDSITLGGTDYNNGWMEAPLNRTFAQHIHNARPAYFPAQIDAGIVCASTADALAHLDDWLAAFPGRYVDLSWGTNDATQGMSPEEFYSNYELLIQKALAAGKVPVIPKIPWGKNATLQANAPALNAQIEKLYAEHPQIIRGPDLWTFFMDHPEYINDGDVHPTNVGYANMRQLWAETMLQSVYATAP